MKADAVGVEEEAAAEEEEAPSAEAEATPAEPTPEAAAQPGLLEQLREAGVSAADVGKVEAAGVDSTALAAMSMGDLKALGLSLGGRKKVSAFIETMRADAVGVEEAPPAEVEETPADPTPEAAAEEEPLAESEATPSDATPEAAAEPDFLEQLREAGVSAADVGKVEAAGVDSTALAAMSMDDLKALGLSLGGRKKVSALIETMKAGAVGVEE